MIVLLPIISSVAFLPLSFLQLVPANSIYISIFFSALTFVGYILFLAAMNGMSKVYGDPRIFRNSLYGFAATATGAIIFTLAAFTFLTPILDQLTAYSNSPGTTPPISIFISLLQAMALIWVGGSILAAINGFFYRRAFNALAEKSGEKNFQTAGLLLLLGGALTILLVGGLISFIGWIIAAKGFFSLKPKHTEAYAPITQQYPTQGAAAQKKCPTCGVENSPDSVYCTHCGNKLSV